MLKWMVGLFFICLPLQILANKEDMVSIKDGTFYDNGAQHTFQYKAFAMWYAPLLGQKGNKFGRERLHAELDSLHALGVNVVTCIAGLQVTQKSSHHNMSASDSCLTLCADEATLSGVDYLLAELQKRQMKAVITLDKAPSNAVQKLECYEKFITQMLQHRNRFTKKTYESDATIMAWNLCDVANEWTHPDSLTIYADWVNRMSQRIRIYDSQHLITAPITPLQVNDEQQQRWLQQWVSCVSLNYVNVPIAPLTQNWVQAGNLFAGMSRAFLRFNDVCSLYDRTFSNADMPYVVNISFPRDAMFKRPGSTTEARDTFLGYVLSRAAQGVVENGDGALRGVTICGWGGMARPNSQGEWTNSIDYSAEWFDEPKGSYAIFNCDNSTLSLIKKYFLDD